MNPASDRLAREVLMVEVMNRIVSILAALSLTLAVGCSAEEEQPSEVEPVQVEVAKDGVDPQEYILLARQPAVPSTDTTSLPIADEPDETAQTREHILLARQGF